ncbi:type II secretion system minor pseudopilin GspK [Planktotalea sp.]|uniref:type II secretion system minor pseudopilin GspK n=1 Tax=Planktotalea sp. TaxID=2029877 RepID=UPI00329A0C66
MTTNRHTSHAGFVLVNALVLVAALAAVAVLLLSRAEEGRARLEATQTADQLSLYLDGFETVAIAVLDQDRANGAIDHATDAWARSEYAVDVDRGRIAGNIKDMQGLFNINWLTNSEDQATSEAFDRLLALASVSSQAGAAIRGFIRNGGPEQRQAYARQTPALDPVGGPLLMFDQLRQIPSLSDRDIERLSTVATALPGDSTLNINTASRSVLASLLPDLRPAALNTVLSRRSREPFGSVEEFVLLIEASLGSSLDDIFPATRLSVGSDWFQVDATATLGPRIASRRAVLFRQPLPAGISTHWRVSYYP